VQRQLDSLKAFEQRHKVKVSEQHRYEDHMPRDLSAKRPDFQRMLKAVASGQLRWLFVDHIDRFGFADQWELVELLSQLRKAGCKLYDACDDEWTSRDLMSFFKVGLAGHASHTEQATKSHRVLGGTVQKAKAGEWLGGPVRLGFDVGCFDRATGKELWRVVWERREVVGKHPKKKTRTGDAVPLRRILRRKVYPDGKTERLDGEMKSFCTSPETQVMRITPTRDGAKLDAARRVFARYATESVSLSGLAKWLNGLRIPNSFGGPFQSNDIKRMLTDEVYMGVITYGKHRNGRFKRYDAKQGIIDIEPELRGKDTESDPDDVIRSRRPDGSRWFEPLIGLETWTAVQAKFRARTKKRYAPKSSKMYLAGLVVCQTCRERMSARTQREEYNCASWDRSRKTGLLDECPCGRHGVRQSLIENYLNRYLEESGKRLELLTHCPTAHVSDRLTGQQESAWDGFCAGVDRLIRYLSEQHPKEYERLVVEAEAQWEADVEELVRVRKTPTSPREGTLVKRYGKKLKDACEEALKPDAPPVRPDAFISELLKSYQANFDPSGLDAEIARLDDEHTTQMRLWANPPTPLSKAKAAAELATLEGQLEELKRQREDVSAAVLGPWRDLQALSVAVVKATKDMHSGDGEHAMRQRAEALRSVLSCIECEFVVSAKRSLVTIKRGEHKGKRMGKGGPGQARSKLVALHFYPLVGDAMVLSVDGPEAGNARSYLTGFA
jgi:DNA invertase Pin-like site-specific DNA recombinase